MVRIIIRTTHRTVIGTQPAISCATSGAIPCYAWGISSESSMDVELDIGIFQIVEQHG